MTAYITQQRVVFGVEPICRTLGAAPSSFYARRSRKPSARDQRDALLAEQIQEARSGFRVVYGVRKTWRELARRGVTDVGRDRVARVMRAHGWRGVQRGRPVRTTTTDTAAERTRDLVNRRFVADAPNQLWVADFVRHEAPLNRAVMEGHRLLLVAASGCSWGQPGGGDAPRGGSSPDNAGTGEHRQIVRARQA